MCSRTATAAPPQDSATGIISLMQICSPATQRTVVSFTEFPANNTVAFVTRQTKLAELLKQGSVSSSGGFIELIRTNQPSPVPPPPLEFGKDFELRRLVDLSGTLYQDNNFLVEAQPGSLLDLDATLAVAANLDNFKLTEFTASVAGRADFNLIVHARANGAKTLEGVKPVITPIHKFYGALIGGVPVWVEIVLEFNVGYSATF